MLPSWLIGGIEDYLEDVFVNMRDLDGYASEALPDWVSGDIEANYDWYLLEEDEQYLRDLWAQLLTRQLCDVCGGRGEFTSEVPCPACVGTGWASVVITCPVCKGIGTQRRHIFGDEQRECGFCGGAKVVTVPIGSRLEREGGRAGE